MAHKTSHHHKRKWYEDKQNLALVLGFVSTVVTLLNTLLEK